MEPFEHLHAARQQSLRQVQAQALELLLGAVVQTSAYHAHLLIFLCII